MQIQIRRRYYADTEDTGSGEKTKKRPRTAQELMKAAGFSSWTGNFKRGIDKLLNLKFIRMTTPDYAPGAASRNTI
jgi:hypothetical protein